MSAEGLEASSTAMRTEAELYPNRVFTVGGFPGTTPLDRAFVQKQLRHDYKRNRNYIFLLKGVRSKVERPDEDESRVVITIMDYTKADVDFLLEDRGVAAKKILRGKAGIDEKVVALAMLPRCMRDKEFTYEMLRSDDVV
ncbi:hypothetical protein PQX77_008943 [Marasmius sp. AFHP31]|nr:hypothetical protein PQX77_008943 [Marasmius sp. AFHP31]